MKLENIHIPKLDKVQLLDRFSSQSYGGTLFVTTSHLIFMGPSKELWLLHGHIDSVKRGPLSVQGCPLTIYCKHFLTLSLVIPRDKECQELVDTLLLCSQPINVEDVFAFSYVPGDSQINVHCEVGPSFGMDWKLEFERMGVDDKWKLTDLNKNYELCDTYPQILMVPSSVSTQQLVGSSRFRSRGRLPVLTYFHSANKAVLCRCSQPLSGFRARCIEDEQVINFIAKTNPNCGILYLVDTRPRVNAIVNKVQGKGFEDESNYANIRFHFFDIENIHVMRASLQKIIERMGILPAMSILACHRPRSMTDFWRGLENSAWLRHVRSVLECGSFLAESIVSGVSCVVHCSDGWDRTAQTVSLAQLFIDPFYRTMAGFRILIEKDWLGFGHKFSDRCGHVGGLDDELEKERAPVFTQFLDVVWQIQRQFPRAFQFNQFYLVTLNDHVHSGQFGTFLGNCDKDRHVRARSAISDFPRTALTIVQDLRLNERTQDLWHFLRRNHAEMTNRFYQQDRFGVLKPDTRPQAIRFWKELYNRFEQGMMPRESVQSLGERYMRRMTLLEAQRLGLVSRMAELTAE